MPFSVRNNTGLYQLSKMNGVIRFLYSVCMIFFLTGTITGQDVDTTRIGDVVDIDEVKVVGYLRPHTYFTTPASAVTLSGKQVRLQADNSLVPAINTVPGVRMEERSAGSYRLSIRGSLVRSPYGVRNVKIYYNGFSLTDGGGNTYLNALNPVDISVIEILKGPDGSLFGPNSGGVVLLRSDSPAPDAFSAAVFGGSYGFAGNAFHVAQRTGKHHWSIRQSYQRADGYRRNTRNHRLFLEASDRWNYSGDNNLESSLFYSDFDYRTPGGLTREQFEADPHQSRPATALLPGSADQHTGVDAKMFFGGIRSKATLLPGLDHTLSVWASFVDYANSAITNYETRDETNLGVRTYFSLYRVEPSSRLTPSLQAGFEAQRMLSRISNYDNHGGIPGEIQAANKIRSYQYFFFLRGNIEWKERLFIQAALSLNYNGYRFRDQSGVKNRFRPVWMPHLGINYLLAGPVSLRLTFSRGYSTPTTAEVRPADNRIYADLQPEKGWNSEAGFRIKLSGGRFMLDASCFRYLLKDGIISRISESGDTYFVNSGRIRQLGIEGKFSWILREWTSGSVIRKLDWNAAYTYSLFGYDRYESAGESYNGNRVAGVPRQVVINSLELRLPADFYLFIQHNFTSRIPLNDANSVYAESYHLVWLKVGLDRTGRRRWPVNLYFAVDNLLNARYSLGNDINAMGGRYFNPAPGCNFQLGVRWKIG